MDNQYYIEIVVPRRILFFLSPKIVLLRATTKKNWAEAYDSAMSFAEKFGYEIRIYQNGGE